MLLIMVGWLEMRMAFSSIFLVLLVISVNSLGCDVDDVKGNYETSGGKSLTLSFDVPDSSYQLTIGDVTESALYRKSDNFSCWLFFSYFDIAIPKILEDGKVMEDSGTKVTVREMSDSKFGIVFNLDIVASPWQIFGDRKLKVSDEPYRYQIKYSDKYGVLSLNLSGGRYVRKL